MILPEGLEYIGEYAFASNGFNGDLIIPGTVKEIASGAFSSSFGATNSDWSDRHSSIILEDGIEIIGNGAFSSSGGAGNNQIFRIPPSVTKFGSGNFDSGLIYASAVQVAWPSWEKPEGWADDWNISSIYSMYNMSMPIIYEDGKYQDDSFYYNRNEDGTYTIAMSKEAEVTEFVIPPEFNGQPVTDIGDYAFSSLEYDGDIVIPDSIKSIGQGAFDDNGSQFNGTITIPTSVTVVGENAFHGLNENLTIVVPMAEDSRPEGWNDEWLIYRDNATVTIIYNP